MRTAVRVRCIEENACEGALCSEEHYTVSIICVDSCFFFFVVPASLMVAIGVLLAATEPTWHVVVVDAFVRNPSLMSDKIFA